MFLEHNRLTAADLARRKTVQQNLQQYFRAACPALRNHIFVSSFGSTTNGFGFRYSDLDIYVEGISMNTAEVCVWGAVCKHKLVQRFSIYLHK